MRRILEWMLLLPAAGLAVPVLVDSALKGAILMALILAAVILLRNASAALRHLVLVSAMVGLLLLPVLSVTLPGWRVLPAWAQTRVLEKGSVPPASAETGSSFAASPVAEIQLPMAAEATAEAEIVSTETNWAALAVWLWVAGGVLFGLRLALSQCLLFKLGRRSRRCKDAGLLAMLEDLKPAMGVGRRVELLLHPARSMPMTWGILKTRLLLPAEAVGWEDGRVRAVLLHELAHVKRRDCLTQMLVQTVCAVHWFNPMVWVAARKIAAERERACDDLVLNSGVRASDYAEHLLRIATGYEDRPITAAAALAMARKSRLEGRLTSILSQRTNRCNITRRVAFVVAVALALLAMPVAMMRAVADEAGDKKSIEELAAEWAAENLEDENGRTIFTTPDGTDVFVDLKPDRIADPFILEDFFGINPRIDPIESDGSSEGTFLRQPSYGFYTLRGDIPLDSISIYNPSSESQKFVPLVGYQFDRIIEYQFDQARIKNLDAKLDSKPIFKREFLAGARNLRGFDFREAGTDFRYLEKKPIDGSKIPMVRVEPGPGSKMRPAAGERLGGKAFVDGYNHVDPAKTRSVPAGADPLLLSERSGLGSEFLPEPEPIDISIGTLQLKDLRAVRAQITQRKVAASTLAKLEVEREVAAQKYKANSPKMVSMDARIELLRKAVGKHRTLEVSASERLKELLASGLGTKHPKVVAALSQLVAQKTKQEPRPVVLKLEKSQAAQVKAAIDGVIGRSQEGRVVVDAQTNSLIYIGDAKTLELVRSMLEHLDK